MPNKDMESLELIKPGILQVLKKNDVARAGVFGSYARGEETPKSDLDMLVEFKHRKSLLGLCGVELELERALKRKVDLLTYNSIHPLLKERILKEEIRIL
jgi:hypothetical protein